MADAITVDLEEDFREIPLAEKKEVVEAYNEIILSHHEKIQTTKPGCDTPSNSGPKAATCEEEKSAPHHRTPWAVGSSTAKVRTPGGVDPR